MLAEFSIIPLDRGMGMKDSIAALLDLVDRSGLNYELTAMGTLVEGDDAKVWDLLRQCHDQATQISDRVETHITIDDRKGVTGRLAGKVREVEAILGRKLRTSI
ncbi:MAG TPA: hypothetical protein DF383_13720 [Deltaproteobacteria bacterium]|nr:hypothetical protein [Deltaproteobacteria bacterium]